MSNSSAWPQSSFLDVLREEDSSSAHVVIFILAALKLRIPLILVLFVCSSYSFPNR